MRSASRSPERCRYRNYRNKLREQEERVGRPLGEPAHEVRIPRRSVRHVHADPVAIRDQPALQIAPDSVEHLELEPLRADSALAHIAAGLGLNALVVRRHRRIGAFVQQLPA